MYNSVLDSNPVMVCIQFSAGWQPCCGLYTIQCWVVTLLWSVYNSMVGANPVRICMYNSVLDSNPVMVCIQFSAGWQPCCGLYTIQCWVVTLLWSIYNSVLGGNPVVVCIQFNTGW